MRVLSAEQVIVEDVRHGRNSHPFIEDMREKLWTLKVGEGLEVTIEEWPINIYPAAWAVRERASLKRRGKQFPFICHAIGTRKTHYLFKRI